MARLIDADAALEAVCYNCMDKYDCPDRCSDYMEVFNIPTVDAIEVVHGQWLFVTKGQQTSVYVCSKCNRAVTVVCDEDIREEQLAKKYPYCHCGARMDGDWNG